jgi:tetratricopeptide (TPR) repeat protein
MPELQTVPELLGKAESAAAAGDLASADELLRAIARIQEDELGPLHPDLANTLNNLAIVAENTGRTGDAETFYRRAVAIASASLSPDDPMLAASRQNLEDFCRAQGLPIDGPAVVEPPTRAAEKSQAATLLPRLPGAYRQMLGRRFDEGVRRARGLLTPCCSGSRSGCRAPRSGGRPDGP